MNTIYNQLNNKIIHHLCFYIFKVQKKERKKATYYNLSRRVNYINFLDKSLLIVMT